MESADTKKYVREKSSYLKNIYFTYLYKNNNNERKWRD